MKKDRDPTERFAFHLITSRDLALNIATDGLQCEQLSFPIEKYLGNFILKIVDWLIDDFSKAIRKMVFICQDVQMFF